MENVIYKKTKLLSAILLTTLTTSLSADLLRSEIGLGVWNNQANGEILSDNTNLSGIDSIKKDTVSNFYAWGIIKHPIPIIPNLRLEYSKTTQEGKALGEFKNFSTNINTNTNLELTQYDIIPYYNILDNTFWITLDLGLDLKTIETKYTVNNVDNYISNEYKENDTVILPLGYVRGRVEIPTTNIGIESDLKYIKYNENIAFDIKAKIDYTFDISPIIQPAIEVGYRIQKYEINEFSDFKINTDYQGFYAGLMLKF